ncbi:MAG: hypothetical protein PHI18_00945 [bacterium]|nr:hypothetical protein [bacterium]
MDDGNLIPGRSSSGRHASHRRGIIVFLILLTVFSLGCTLPEAPGEWSWDTHLQVPLGVRTYSLAELVDSDDDLASQGSGIGLGSDSVLYYTSITRLSLAFNASLFFEPIVDTLYKPAEMQDTTHHFALTDQPHRVLRGVISSGTVRIQVRNLDPATADTAEVFLPDLYDHFGDGLLVKVFVPGGATVDTTMDLATYVLRLEDDDPQYSTAVLHSSQPVPIIATVQTSRIYFEYFDGELRNLALDSVIAGIAVDAPPEGWESVFPTRLDLFAHLPRSLTATTHMDVTWHTFERLRILSQGTHEFADVYLGSDTTLALLGVSGWSGTYPDSVNVTASMILNGRVQSYTSVTIPVVVEIRAPLAFTMDTTHPSVEVIRVESTDLKDIQSGTARIRIWNRLPIGGSAFLVAAHDSSDVLENSGAAVDTVVKLDVPLPPITDGRATAEAFAETEVTLSDAVVEMLRNPPFFTRTDILLPGSNGDTLYAHVSDYVKVQVIADVIYRINTEDGE